jgi:hypothetical protein
LGGPAGDLDFAAEESRLKTHIQHRSNRENAVEQSPICSGHQGEIMSL